MKRREFLQQSISIAAATGISSRSVSAGENAARSRLPNILFIMTDQQRSDCMGANGNPIIQTPNLDRLAEQSANFSHAFVQAPVCTPSRVCYFTGRYAHSHRNRVNYTPLDESEILMPARLKQAGYRTGIVGKSHIYYQYPPTPYEAKRTGFDIVELHDGAHSTDPWSAYVQWRNERDAMRDKYNYRALARNVADLSSGANPYRAAIDELFTDTTWTGLRTRHHLSEMAKSGQPFFLFSSFWKPHSPYEVPVPFDSLYDDMKIPLPKRETLESIHQLPLPLQKLILRGKKPPYDTDPETLEWIYRSYYGSITHIDREVGAILETLEQTGLADNTIVVFASDHGDQMLEHGLFGKNCFFEASIRIPFLIRYPGRIRPGNYDALAESIDLLPTVFELMGLPEPYSCQGRSLVPLISGADRQYDEREAVFSENIIPEVFGIDNFRFDKGKGIKGIRHPDAKMVRTRKWKYNYYPEGYAELYDLENDPLEQRNLAGDAQYKSTVDEMKGRILDWLINSVETDQIAPTWLV